jgi:hypothetical protein
MPFIGNQPALSYTSFAKQDFTTSATTSYTLDNPVANANELALFINFVRQEPTTAYTASGTTLTLTSATSATDDMYCVFLGKAVQTVNPPNGSVGTAQLSDDAVTSAKINYPLTTFSSTGIDDNASANALTIDSSSNLQFNSGYGSVATAYGVRAWVNFNGQGTIAINDSGNVSSLTDLGTGFYQINFTTAMPDINYAVCGMSKLLNDGASNASNFTTTSIDRDTNSLSTGFVKICAGRTGATGGDASDFYDVYTQTVAVFR